MNQRDKTLAALRRAGPPMPHDHDRVHCLNRRGDNWIGWSFDKRDTTRLVMYRAIAVNNCEVGWGAVNYNTAGPCISLFERVTDHAYFIIRELDIVKLPHGTDFRHMRVPAVFYPPWLYYGTYDRELACARFHMMSIYPSESDGLTRD